MRLSLFVRSLVRPAFVSILTLAFLLPASALDFVFTPVTGTSQQAINGFVAAGNRWSSLLADQITVNITIGFSDLSSGILAQAGSALGSVSYSNIRTALTADVTSINDVTAVANLQTGPVWNFVTNNQNGTTDIDTDGTVNNTDLLITRANAKALGLIAANASGADAQITFNTDFSYDFNPDDGITAGLFDFVGLATHEIGHALGFISGVDTVDLCCGPNAPTPRNLENEAVFNTLDLFRFSSQSDTIINGNRVQDLRQGGTPFFSLDRGETNLGLFATGPFDGDGRQASHWKDNLALGVMDPTAGAGERLFIRNLDIQAFDVIGYDVFSLMVIPEPTSATLALVGSISGISFLARRKLRP